MHFDCEDCGPPGLGGKSGFIGLGTYGAHIVLVLPNISLKIVFTKPAKASSMIHGYVKLGAWFSIGWGRMYIYN